jgi:hypothetical protein
MQIPTIHLNGTSKDSLVEGLCNASAALDAAYQELKKTAPNGRDYYPQGAKAMEAAEREHMSRLRRLDEVKKEVDELAEAIYQAGE